MNAGIWSVLQKAAADAKVDPFLVGAVAMTESSWNPAATRFEPDYPYLWQPLAWAVRVGIPEEEETKQQKTSYGLMQVMGGVARRYGFSARSLVELCRPEVGAALGCRHLAGFLAHHADRSDAIASYNAGSPRKNADGTYSNQAYVDAVLAHEAELKRSLA